MTRAAIIGFGGMGQRHFKAYKAAGVDIAAICEWDPARVAKVLPDFPMQRVYKDAAALFAAEKVDIVSVVSNGPTHAVISKQAALAGVPRILCEKPMATNLREARELIEVCHGRRTRLAVNHIRRFSPSYDAIRKLIKDGVIGRLRHIYFHSGSTGLGNFAIHAFDTMRMLFESDAHAVSAFLDRTGTPNPRGAQFKDPAGYGSIRFENGARAMVDTSEDTGVQYQYVLVGEIGRIVIDELNDKWEVTARAGADRELPFTRYGTAMPAVPFKNPVPFDIVDLTSRAILNLLSDEPVLSGGEDGYKSLEMVVAFHASDDRNGAAVTLPLPADLFERDIPIG